MNRLRFPLFTLAIVAGSLSPGASPSAQTSGPPDLEATVSGSLSIAVEDDFALKRARIRYRLRTTDGKNVDVHFVGAAPRNLRAGATITLRGRFDKGRMIVDSSKTSSVQTLDVPARALAQPAPQKRRVLMLLLDITDSTGTRHTLPMQCDAISNDTAGLMFGGSTRFPEHVAGAYLESSFGLEGVGGKSYPGNVTDVVRVPVRDTLGPFNQSCNAAQWADAADAAAVSAGVNLTAYQHRTYVLPKNSGCVFGGLGDLDCGSSCRTWQNTYDAFPCGLRGTHAHELGHNRGFMHASTDFNNDGVIDQEYGDYSDFMGGSSDELSQNNAPHKVKMGWVDPADVVNAEAGGRFTLSALELANPPYPQVLRIGPVDGSALYVSYRARIGYDTVLNLVEYYNTTSVHRWDPNFYSNTLMLAYLADGQTKLDAREGVSIRQVSHGSDFAVVDIVRSSPTSPSLSIADVSVSEGNSGTTTMTFTVVLSKAAPAPVTYSIATANGTAVAGTDYTAKSLIGESIPTGALSRTFEVTVSGDSMIESDETVLVSLSGVNGATISDGQATGTITNDDLPKLTINDFGLVEGNSGTKAATFTVSLSQAATAPVRYTVATANSSSVSGSDYVATTLVGETMPVGQTSKTFTVTVNGDTVVEANERFFVNLSAAEGATILDGQGVANVLNDDGPILSIGDVVVAEGNTGAPAMVFTVKLSQAAAVPVTYSIATANVTAMAGSDYTAKSLIGEVMAAGQTSKSFSVALIGDAAVEANETIKVNLTAATGASIVDGQGIGTILNDDGPRLSVSDVGLAEGNGGIKTASFIVSLNQITANPVTFTATTASGTATAGSDYIPTSQTHTISAGQLAKTVTVTIIGDTTVEANESINLVLTSASGATIYDVVGVANVVNDDGPNLRVGDVSILEGNSGTKILTFTVNTPVAAAGTITYNIATADGSATVAGNDYVPSSLVGQTMAAGSLSKVFAVAIKGDTAIEANETVKVSISAASGATIFDSQGIGTITNDD